MKARFAALVAALAARRRAWRRARNSRVGAARLAPRARTRASIALRASARPWLLLGGVTLVLGGAALIAGHARALHQARGAAATLDAFEPALPGLRFEVSAAPGLDLRAVAGGALLVASQLRAAPPVVIDLCGQMLAGSAPRIAPLRIGYPFADVARWVARNDAAPASVTLRNVVLASATMPRVDISGAPGQGLQLAWSGQAARWIGAASGGAIIEGERGAVALGAEGWLVWGAGDALRIARRPSLACPQAGELLLTRHAIAPTSPTSPAAPGASAGTALVLAFGRQGAPIERRLAPGSYRVSAQAPLALEDGALFDSLLAHGLLRLGPGGRIQTAPPDLAAWRDADPRQRMGNLHDWDSVVLDAPARRLLTRLHGRADGAYVQAQVRQFNDERQLLAWRTPDGPVPSAWQLRIGADGQAGAGALAVTGTALPAGAASMLATLEPGWTPWQRVAGWPPGAGSGDSAQLVLDLPQPARGDEQFALLLAGRIVSMAGVGRARDLPACSARACPRREDVRSLLLTPAVGARRIVLQAAPLTLAQASARGDAAYRHLHIKAGQLAWQALPAQLSKPAPARSAVVLLDRSGALLWQDGAPTAGARAAGLATLLGQDVRDGSSVAGMLARVANPGALARSATLTLDLALQQTSDAVLDCVGMRRGRWDGARCQGGSAPPAGRQAGLVVLDTGSGDILAAASSNADAPPPGLPWEQLRALDAVDAARSPLRQAALQHDGGAERSPGSTFKIISALGLELAAQRDARLDALLGGLALEQIDAQAGARGFAFRSDAPVYPATGGGAHITNYREASLVARVRDGRLGLAEALTHSINTWFAWSAELSDASLFGRASGGVPSLRALDPGALDPLRPILAMARRVGFEQRLRLDGALLPPDFDWRRDDVLQASSASFDPIGSRHELRQMAIGLRMQVTPLHMALAAGAIGEGRALTPRLLRSLDGRAGAAPAGAPLGVRLDRIRAGLQGVVASGTAAAAFRDPALAPLRGKLFGKTGTAPNGAAGQASVWFCGWLEPGSLPGQTRRLAFAVFISRSDATGGAHAAPVVAALLASLAQRSAATSTPR